MSFKPEEQLKTLWLITWTIVFIIVLVLWVVLVFIVDPFIFIACIAGWFIIMVPILFWIPRAYRALKYSITDDSVEMMEGVLWKKHVTVPYLKITNVDITQGPLERALGIGTIHVQTAGAGGQQGQKAELKISGVKNLEELQDIILSNIKAYHLSRPVDIEKTAGKALGKTTSREVISLNSQLLDAILKELSAIRKKIEG